MELYLDWQRVLIIILFKLIDLTVGSLLTVATFAIRVCGTLRAFCFPVNFDLEVLNFNPLSFLILFIVLSR